MKLSAFYAALLLAPSIANASLVDITPPELLGLTLSPNLVNVNTGEQIVDVQFEFADDLSGLNYMYLSVLNPSGTTIGGAYASPDPWYELEGDELGGILKTSFTIPQYAEDGDYTYYVTFQDNNNNSDYLGYEELVTMGFGEQLSVISAVQDITPPELLGLTLSPNLVDVTTGEQTVDVQFEFADDLSGLNYMYLSVLNPSGTTIGGAYASPDPWYELEGDELGGILKTSFTIPQYAEDGDYTYYVTFQDNNNNSDYLGYEELVTMGFGEQLSVGVLTEVSEPQGYLLASLGLILLFRARKKQFKAHLCA